MTGGEVAYALHSTVYRVLKESGMHQKKADDQAKHPLNPYEHGHMNIS